MDKEKKEIPEKTIEKKNDTISRMVKVRSKLNRSFDLHLGRDVIIFEAHEEKEIPRIFLLHEKWQRVKNNFQVKEG